MKQHLLFIVLIISVTSFAQDSTHSEWKFQKKVIFWTKWQDQYNARISMPAYIHNERKLSTGLPLNFDSISDNPLQHCGTYIALKTQSDFKNKVSLFADVYAEHRGASYGLFDQHNTVVYPIVRLEAKDTFHIFCDDLKLKGRAGQFLEERMDEGLMIYNIDLQGMQLQADFKNFSFQYSLYGDLCNGIGLEIDDLEAFSLSRRFKDHSIIGVSWAIDKPYPDVPLKNNYTVNLFAGKPVKDGRVYAQIGFRPFNVDFYNVYDADANNKIAFVVGLHKAESAKKIDYSFDAAIRYYGFAYNLFHESSDFRYRKPAYDDNTMYANTVGDYLYPLRKFDTPFSQWAVYTEYHGYNVTSGILNGNLNYHPVKKFAAFLDFDINYIYGQLDISYSDPQFKSTSWLYPFFNAGLVYLPVENVRVKGSFTNKGMNLDLAYPTHYLLNKPCFELSLVGEF